MFKGIGKFGIGIGTSVWRAYVLTVMWAWFVASSFAVPAMSVPVALGILYTAMLFKKMPKQHEVDEHKQEDFTYTALVNIFLPAVVLGAGWIIKLFM